MTIYFVWRRSDGHVAAPTMPTHPRLQNSVEFLGAGFIRGRRLPGGSDDYADVVRYA